MKKTIAIAMALLVSNLPHLAAAEVAEHQMMPTSQFIEEIDRETTKQNIDQILSRADVRHELEKAGLNPKEISQRIAGLSDAELKDLHSQMQNAQYAGDGVVGVLVLAVLVLLIIFLAKRI